MTRLRTENHLHRRRVDAIRVEPRSRVRHSTQNSLKVYKVFKTTNNKSVQTMVFELDVTNIIGDIIYEITKEDLRYPTESPLANAAYFEKMFEMTIGEMEMDVPDYADWTLQRKYTNEFFRNEL